jgi:hypothetical protein
MGKKMWASSEMYAFTDRRHYEYGYSNGRFACVNLEVSMLTAPELQRFMKECYAYGMEFVSLYNAADNGEDDCLTELDQAADTAVPTPHPYCRFLLDVDFLRDYRTDGNIEKVIQRRGVDIVADGYVALQEKTFDGTMDFVVHGCLGKQLTLRCEATAVNHNDIEFFISQNHRKYESIGFFQNGNAIDWFNKNSVNLIKVPQIPIGDTVWLRVKLKKPESRLKALKVLIPWEVSEGLPLAAVTYREERRRHRFVQQRLIAERLLALYNEKGDVTEIKKVVALLEMGRYGEAITWLYGAMACHLPARFAVKGNGKLGNYPIHVALPTEDDCAVFTFTEIDSKRTTFRYYVDKLLDVKVRLPQGRWHVKVDAYEQCVVLTHAEDAPLCEEITLPLLPLPPKVFHEHVSGNCKGLEDGYVLLESQDEVGENANFVKVPLSDSCRCYRRLFGTNAWESAVPEYGDCLQVRMDGHGGAAELYAEYGSYTGKIVNFELPVLRGENRHNGRLTMDNGQVYELSFNKDFTVFSFRLTKALAAEIPLEMVEQLLSSGRMVGITFSPYTYDNSVMRLHTITAL